ncbi:glycoside hydrolase family 43 protein, partial [Serendipita vermifera]
FKNPLKTSNGSDPFMVYSNGYYYLITTTWSNLQLTRGRTLAELKASSPKTIWQDSTSSRCCNYWAGEIHSINGVWYIYYTAGPSGTNYDNQRLHVIKASSTDLWASTWSYAGRLAFPNRDIWSIDGSVLKLNGNNYIIYSGQDTGGQCLFIAQLTSPTTVGNAYILSRPTLSWEQVGYAVNEGPVALYKNGRTWIAYSASLCSGTGYKLGLLEYTSGDPLNINSWKKYSQPVLQSANGNYQPGHNGFFLSPSGQQWIVYHANSVTPGQCDGSRYTMAQPVEWNSDGTPRFQAPAPLSSNIPEPV